MKFISNYKFLRSPGRLRKLLLASGLSIMALAQSFGSVALTGPTPLAADGNWVHFRWFSQIVDPGDPIPSLEEPFVFTIPNGSTGRLDVTDFSLPGDAFKLTDAVSGGMWWSSAVSTAPIVADEDDPDAAFADSNWSSGSFNLGPGDYEIGIELTQLTTVSGSSVNVTPPGAGVLNGGGFLRLNVSPVPEPGSAMWLMGVGLFVGLRRRRQ